MKLTEANEAAAILRQILPGVRDDEITIDIDASVRDRDLLARSRTRVDRDEEAVNAPQFQPDAGVDVDRDLVVATP